MYDLCSFDVDLPLLESLTLVSCDCLESVRIPQSVQRLCITQCEHLSLVEWSTSPVDTDSFTLNIVRDMYGNYTLQ
jgi:hypothetical protein